MRLADPRRDARGDEAALDRGDGHVPGQAPVVRRRVLRPEADPAAPRDLGGRRRREGHAAHRGQARRQDQLADGHRRASCASRACSSSTATRSAATSTPIVRTHGPDCCRVRHRGRHEALARLARRRIACGARSPHDEYVRDNFVGTAEQVGEKVQEFVDAGCREFVLWFRDCAVVRQPRSVRARRRFRAFGAEPRRAPASPRERAAARCYLLRPVTLLSDAPARDDGIGADRRPADAAPTVDRRRGGAARRAGVVTSGRARISGSTRRCRSTSRGCRSADLDQALRHDGAPPLYYALLHVWTRACSDRATGRCGRSRACAWSAPRRAVVRRPPRSPGGPARGSR